jgi:hypothetical protein
MFCWACGRCTEARNASHSAPISESGGRLGMLARRIARFDKQSIAEIKRRVEPSLPFVRLQVR